MGWNELHIDRYENFAALANHHVAKRDFRIVTRAVPGSDTIILAIHGGKIEPRTSEIARAIAGAEFNLYLFEGMLVHDNFKILHITADNFDEPVCLQMVAPCRRVVTIHGCAGRAPLLMAGGLDETMKSILTASLGAEGVKVKRALPRLCGTGPTNPCNRGLTGAGVQIEISRGLRGSDQEGALIRAVRNVLTDKQPESS